MCYFFTNLLYLWLIDEWGRTERKRNHKLVYFSLSLSSFLTHIIEWCREVTQIFKKDTFPSLVVFLTITPPSFSVCSIFSFKERSGLNGKIGFPELPVPPFLGSRPNVLTLCEHWVSRNHHHCEFTEMLGSLTFRRLYGHTPYSFPKNNSKWIIDRNVNETVWNSGVPIAAQQKWTWLVSMRRRVRFPAPLSALRIQGCPEPRCRSQMQLGSHIDVAVVQASSCSFDWTPSLGTSIGCQCGCKKAKKEKRKLWNSQKITQDKMEMTLGMAMTF